MEHIGDKGTAAGGTTEIVVNGNTGWLHPAGKEGVTPLAQNIVRLATDVETRLKMGKQGSTRVKQMFLERHMSQRISLVLKEVLLKAKKNAIGLQYLELGEVSQEKAKILGISFTPSEVSLKDIFESLKEKYFLSF
ncbi:Glycosyl transferase [Olea europaea subsp. europaea]|uniref:Glycosyl transferase n=1 Tax=Olea europaea subsp. europaea TaxID=158383 RepID=A0A8S0UYU5_OLEEU|nr:Glycosyl transferase [Olea europaea subsp. europaea]